MESMEGATCSSVVRTPEFSQCFGDKAALEELTDADLLTALEFDLTGDYLATGDRGGRVVLFEKGDDIKQVTANGRRKWACKYRFYSEFQSHEPEFDYLKSLEIEEKINQIKWCPTTNNSHFLLSTNDKTIKLWRIRDRQIKEALQRHETPPRPGSLRSSSPARSSPFRGAVGGGGVRGGGVRGGGEGGGGAVAEEVLQFPRLYTKGSMVTATNKRCFSNAHAYHINSLSVNVDGQTFLSADDLRINLWSLENHQQAYNIVDLKPANMDDLNEVITSASFHPSASNLVMFSSSKGAVRVADLRTSALCTQPSLVLENHIEDPIDRSFFSEIISSVADARYCRGDGRFLFTRDYLTVKVWDMHMPSAPVSIMTVNPSLRPLLADLYETDAMFDKFECAVSGNGQYFATGTYNNTFQVRDREGRAEASHAEVSRTVGRKQRVGGGGGRGGMMRMEAGKRGGRGGRGGGVDGGGDVMAFDKKVMHLAWHPERDVLAVAGLNRLYFYTV